MHPGINSPKWNALIYNLMNYTCAFPQHICHEKRSILTYYKLCKINSIHHHRLSIAGLRGRWSLSQLIPLGERQTTPRTGRHCITELTYRDKYPFTLRIHTGEPGRNPCRHREKMQTQQHTERPCQKGQESNPQPSCCDVTVLITAPLCHLSNIKLI